MKRGLSLLLPAALVAQHAVVSLCIPTPAENLTAAGQSVSWVKFDDSAEKAFSVDVPQGWTVKGGLFRLGFSDTRAMVDLTSPDGKTNVRLGDVSIPSYSVPTQFHAREGEVYDLGAQAQMIVARYRSGPEFAILYSHARFYRVCQNPAADASDVDFSLPDYWPADSNYSRTSTGQIAYHCSGDQGPRVAFAFARTSNYGTLWQVPTLGSFIAPPENVAFAKNVLLHCAQSFQVNPSWIEYQKKMDADGLQYQRVRQQQRLAALGQQVRQFEAQMQSMRNQVGAFESRQNAQAAQVEGFTQALRGVTPTIDPLTGGAREVWTGPNSQYWTNGLGQVVNSNSQPPGNWHQLQPTSPN
ncbi:MAG: hypothetical protein WCA38_14920 [Candidatus Acidiferrales bacterium]